MGAPKRHSTTLDESVRYSLAINPQFELGIELGIEETLFFSSSYTVARTMTGLTRCILVLVGLTLFLPNAVVFDAPQVGLEFKPLQLHIYTPPLVSLLLFITPVVN